MSLWLRRLHLELHLLMAKGVVAEVVTVVVETGAETISGMVVVPGLIGTNMAASARVLTDDGGIYVLRM